MAVTDTGHGISAERCRICSIRSTGRKAPRLAETRVGARPVDRAQYRAAARRRRGGEQPGAGLGTTVTVTLPVDWDADDPAADPARPATALKAVALDGYRVLVVDDDATSRASLAAALETFGAQVALAHSGRDALNALSRQRPGVVLSDLAMPDGDGFGCSITSVICRATTHARGCRDRAYRRGRAQARDGGRLRRVSAQAGRYADARERDRRRVVRR
jgi:hypothetical protein